MKLDQKSWRRLAAFLLLCLILTTVGITAAQEQISGNLLTNPGFEAGHHHQDGIPEITVPNDWRLHWLDGVYFLGSDAPAARPESVVWFIGDAPLNERSLFFRDGSFALKVFKGGLPMYAALSQNVSGLEVGRRYRLSVPIYIDIVAAYNSSGKVAPADLESGLVRLGASPVGAAWLDDSAIDYSGWWTAATINPFYQAYPVFIHEFTATHQNMTIWIEFGSRDTYANNGFFLDLPGLFALNQTGQVAPSGPAPVNPPAAGPSPTPFPTPTPRADGAIVHVVQAGDSFWSLAIRYAPALGLTPEQALPAIRELNNNPAFLVVGQEVVIAPPGAAEVEPAIAATEEPSATETPAGGSEAVAEAETLTAEATPTESAPEPEPTPVQTAPIEAAAVAVAPATNAICVSAFDDVNGDGSREVGEELLPDAVFTISRPSGTVATYVSDGINEPYCLRDLEADTYQIAFSQPGGYRLTTAGNWAIAVSGGTEIPVQFGAQFDTAAVAAVQPAEVTGSEDAAQITDDGATEDGISSRIGMIALGIAIVLVVLAGVGVILLRRS